MFKKINFGLGFLWSDTFRRLYFGLIVLFTVFMFGPGPIYRDSALEATKLAWANYHLFALMKQTAKTMLEALCFIAYILLVAKYILPSRKNTSGAG